MRQEPIPNTVIRYEFDATLTLLMQQKMPSKILPAIFHCIRSLHKNMIAAENGGELDRDKVVADLTWAIEHLLAIRHSIVEMFGVGPRRATTQDKFIALRTALRRLLAAITEEVVLTAQGHGSKQGGRMSFCRWNKTDSDVYCYENESGTYTIEVKCNNLHGLTLNMPNAKECRDILVLLRSGGVRVQQNAIDLLEHEYRCVDGCGHDYSFHFECECPCHDKHGGEIARENSP